MSDYQSAASPSREMCGYIIQARLGSTRLPGKALLYFGGTTVIGYLIKSLIDSGVRKDSICVTTSLSHVDDVLASYIDRLGIKVVRGDEDNVLMRFQKAASECGFTDFVRLTGDNPLLDIQLIQHCVKIHQVNSVAMTTTREVKNKKVIRYVPKGLSIDVINSKALLSIEPSQCTSFETEHVIPFFYKNFPVYVVKNYVVDSEERSIDTIEDYARLYWVPNSVS